MPASSSSNCSARMASISGWARTMRRRASSCMNASRAFADAPARNGTPRPFSNEQRSDWRLSIISRHTAWSLTATTSPTLSPDCCARHCISGCASRARCEAMSNPSASCRLIGPGAYRPSDSSTKPHRLSSTSWRYSELLGKPVVAPNSRTVIGWPCCAKAASTKSTRSAPAAGELVSGISASICIWARACWPH